ncbi:methyltransferase [Myxococcota bacterium]|nr:methyltransferase [Myxococcota bacterium]
MTPSPLPDLRPDGDETLDALTGDWKLLQRRRGHRFSTDDLLCAWWALREAPRGTDRVLDLGCGIGSVLLMVAWGLPGARAVGVEVQAESHALAVRNVRLNRQEGRIEVRRGDLRDPGAVPEAAAFALVTGSPPYVPMAAGLASPVPQKAAARLEVHGGIEDYCRAAARALAPGGAFCAVQPDGERVRAAARAAGLRVVRSRPVVPKEGRDPLFHLWTLARSADLGPGREEDLPPLLVRDREGRRTEEMRSVRREMGMPE